jgi:hypothetical protein
MGEKIRIGVIIHAGPQMKSTSINNDHDLLDRLL